MRKSAPRQTPGADQSVPAPRSRRVDLTLSPRLDADGRPIAPAPPFPEVGRGARLVLYPVRTGLAVDWDLADLGMQDALATFPDYLPPPQGSIRLCRIGDGGRVEVIAQTEISALGDAGETEPRGQQRFAQPDGHSQYQAELGLTTPGGGWVLLLRSNRIAIGADQPPLLRPAAASADGDARATTEQQRDQAPRAIAEKMPAAKPAAASNSLARWSLGHRHSDASIDADQTSADLHGSSAEAPSPSPPSRREDQPDTVEVLAPPNSGAQTSAGHATRPPTPDLPGRIHAVRYLTDGRVLVGADTHAAPRTSTELPADPLRAPDDSRAAGQASSGAAVLPERSASPGTDTETIARSSVDTDQGQRNDRRPRPGSGPITDHRNADAVGLSAELIISGHAPPGTMLDLGGHPYRVGPGGRFQLRIPVPEHDRIMALLRQLPRLPVEGRD